MGTLVQNNSLSIDFEVPEILQKDLEIYERAMGKYLTENGFDNTQRTESVAYSGIAVGAIEAQWIPKDVLSDLDDVRESSPKKVIFISARIAEAIDAAKNSDLSFKFKCPEITQGHLEDYEKYRNQIIDGLVYSPYETALSNSLMVQIALKVGWISDDIITIDTIPESNPNKITYLANQITIAAPRD